MLYTSSNYNFVFTGQKTNKEATIFRMILISASMSPIHRSQIRTGCSFNSYKLSFTGVGEPSDFETINLIPDCDPKVIFSSYILFRTSKILVSIVFRPSSLAITFHSPGGSNKSINPFLSGYAGIDFSPLLIINAGSCNRYVI